MKKALSLSLSLSLSDSVTLKPHKLLLVLSLALLLASASFLFVLLPAQQAQATQVGFPIYSWGSAPAGQQADAADRLGRPVTAENPRNLPARNPGPSNWKMAATGSLGSYAVNIDGELFAWGNLWNAMQMGLGGQPGSGMVSVPTQIGTETNWKMVAARINNVAALNYDGEVYVWGNGGPLHTSTPTRIDEAPDNVIYLAVGNTNYFVITDEGFMYSWGSAAESTLARGGVLTAPGRVIVEGREDLRWKTVSVSGLRGFAITRCGELFSWGSTNTLGRDSDGVHPPNTRPGVVTVFGESVPRNNWTDVVVTTDNIAVLNSNGEMYTWGPLSNIGSPRHGRAILGDHPFNAPGNRPGIVVDSNGVPYNKFVSLHGGAQHFLAFTNTNELWGWGSNPNGEVGVGNYDNVYRPTHVADVVRFSDAARGAGNHSLMLMEIRFPITELNLTKHLQKPVGTPAPNLNFRFTFERNSFNDNTAPADIARIPVINPIILNPTTVVSPPPPPAGTITLEAYFDFLDGIVFTEVGTYSWIIREDATHPAGQGLDSEVVFSQASYELRVYVGQEAGIGGDLYVRFITLHRLTDPVTGTPLDPPQKVNNLIFVNTYTYDPFITPTGLFLTSGSSYLVFLATGVTLAAYLSLRARKRIEELPPML